MKINGTPYRTIWPTSDGAVEIIDQTRLPHVFVTLRLNSMRDAEFAIRSMQVRGAHLRHAGQSAAYGGESALGNRAHARFFVAAACRKTRRGGLA